MENLKCPDCSSYEVIKKGYTSTKFQQYLCKCGHRFRSGADTPKAAKRYEKINKLLAKGGGVREISRKTGYAVGTIRSYLVKMVENPQAAAKRLEGFSTSERLNVWCTVLRNRRQPIPIIPSLQRTKKLEEIVAVEDMIKQLASEAGNEEVELKAQANSYRHRAPLLALEQVRLEEPFYASYFRKQRGYLIDKKVEPKVFFKGFYVWLHKHIKYKTPKNNARDAFVVRQRSVKEFVNFEIEHGKLPKNYALRRWHKKIKAATTESDKERMIEKWNDRVNELLKY